jgi:hypothetical protein
MPPISIGDPCVWRHSPGHAATAAQVTRVGREAVSLILFPPDSRGGVVKDGVRFIGDPELPRLAHNDTGCWDYTARQKLVNVVLDGLLPDSEGNVQAIPKDARKSNS